MTTNPIIMCFCFDVASTRSSKRDGLQRRTPNTVFLVKQIFRFSFQTLRLHGTCADKRYFAMPFRFANWKIHKFSTNSSHLNFFSERFWHRIKTKVKQFLKPFLFLFLGNSAVRAWEWITLISFNFKGRESLYTNYSSLFRFFREFVFSSSWTDFIIKSSKQSPKRSGNEQNIVSNQNRTNSPYFCCSTDALPMMM